MSEELLLLPAITVMLPPLLVKISFVKHLRTLDLCPCPKEETVLWRSLLVRLLQTLQGWRLYAIAGQSALIFKSPVTDAGLATQISLSLFLHVAGISFGDKDMQKPLAIFCQHLFFLQLYERNTVLEMPGAGMRSDRSCWFSSLAMCVCIFHTAGGAFQFPLAWNPLQYFQVSASQLNKGDSFGDLKSVSFQYSTKSRSYLVRYMKGVIDVDPQCR